MVFNKLNYQFFNRTKCHFNISFNQFAKLCTKPNLCIVGSGPSAFYTAQYILKIDMFEKLPAPFGLVRYGVAPDHQDVKNVINTFTEVAQNPRFRFIGNINIGKDLKLHELQHSYSIIIWAYGASVDRILNIPGENLPGVISARDLVGWYNGYPKSEEFVPDLDCETAVIIGMGNVAIDIARILLSMTERLKHTDIPESVMEHLKKSRIRRVIIVGRRGPLHVAFSIKSMREFSKLKQTEAVKINICPSTVFENTIGSNNDIQNLLAELPRPRRRLTEFLFNLSKSESSSSSSGTRQCDLLFLRSPIEIIPKSDGESRNYQSRIGQLKLAVNRLEGSPTPDQSAVLDSNHPFEYIDCGLVVRSIGFRGICIDPDLPFDHKLGVIKCENINTGLISDLPTNLHFNSKTSPMYATGWIKRGPVGVILDTASDAIQTAEAIVEHLAKLESDRIYEILNKPGFNHISKYFHEKGLHPVYFNDWQRVDLFEKASGQKLGKPREKLTTIDSLLKTAFLLVAQNRNS